MNKTKYLPGQIVRRIPNTHHKGMKAGDEDVIISVDTYGSVTLAKFGQGHSKGSLEIIRENWKQVIESAY